MEMRLAAQEEIKAKIIASVDKMPSLPTTVGKIIQLAHDIKSSQLVGEIAHWKPKECF